MNDELLLDVKKEALENLHFTPKETDIYRIHQSGDLANISGLPAELQAKLPSLKKLRDALYSQQFRDYVCGVTGCGALSGSKTDMAINVYTPGCHLLTHDDVIGSRRVSYILYLCGSPTEPWDPSWGGALRLYPTVLAADGTTKVPTAEWSKVIPPGWNQLSFFEVVPGESFHDVEEVYDCAPGEERIRMAISGWFHIPQLGEPGYIAGLEEELAKKSSLQSLQSKADVFDKPQPKVTPYPEPAADDEDPNGFTEEDIDFLLQYISPTFLTPDTLEQLSTQLADEGTLQIGDFLRPPFLAKLKAWIDDQESEPSWKVAIPPHKQRFLYLEPSHKKPKNPFAELTSTLFPSPAFKKWLQLATDSKLTDHSALTRRFRPSLDYTLATPLPADIDTRLEITLSVTPPAPPPTKAQKDPKTGKIPMPKPPKPSKFDDSTRSTGGYEMYLATDEDEEEDAAVYKAADDDDDGVLFSSEPAWNELSVVIRDQGALRFTKYCGKKGQGRWDVCGYYGVAEGESGEDSSSDGEEEEEGSGEEEGSDEDAGGSDDDDEEEASSDKDDSMTEEQDAAASDTDPEEWNTASSSSSEEPWVPISPYRGEEA